MQLRRDVEERINALRPGFTYRQIAAAYGMDIESDAATLCNIVNGKPVSKKLLRRVASALRVKEVRRPYTPRPVTTLEQAALKEELGVEWRDVIDVGLQTLKRESEREYVIVFPGQRLHNAGPLDP